MRFGVARAEALDVEGERLRAWVAAGRHGEMQWMAETAEVRVDPRHPGMLAGAQSVLVFVAPYARRASADEPVGIARYARGRDYHNVLHKRLRTVTALLREAGFEARASVDSLPVMERAWAARAGVGFIGKNCCLIVPGIGSHVFLATVITTAELEPDAPMPERCGTCRACLDACPTRAFVSERELDARRCISYLTIESRGPAPHELREGIGDWMFGCDVCQDVCPFNRTAPPPAETTRAFAPAERWSQGSPEAVLAMDEASFATWAHGSPIQRPTRAGMARNAAIVLGNRGDKRHLPILDAAAEHDSSPVVRESAAWAAGRIRNRP